ncbi:hypothetical protein KC19_10G169100 [Ceratodon purpureus]|uniref:Heterokaryon incompatibility domain-containing protein n=1 Tax=Ceratodon purpureus TaxID=3225 RepID=A0A8T0GMP0_CERPU|nr:hypothetical protein KC19_10G169100 [Ceratodon purpureus]
MEHWPTPLGLNFPVHVPYVCTEDYDGENFFEFPLRKGWTKRRLHECLDPGKQPGGEAFFQSWLFFGCLIEVFKVVGIRVRSLDFRQGEYLTTEMLPTFIQRWRDIEPNRRKVLELFKKGELDSRLGFRENYLARRRRIKLILLRVQKYVRLYSSGKVLMIHQFRLPSCSVSHKVWLSIMALAHTLRQAARRIYGPQDFPSNKGGYNHILCERILMRGWCKAECANFVRDMDIDFLYYVGSVESPRRDENHGNCTERACVAKGIDIRDYKTKHDVQDCSCCEMEVDVHRVVEIILQDGIPLVSWDGKKIRVIKYDGKSNYVAISHVWRDGMGNQNKNALPACQLTRIQASMTKLYSTVEAEEVGVCNPKMGHNLKEDDPKELPVGYWMDTLCLPAGETVKPYRKQAISQMLRIYRSAHRVLVLDNWLENLDRGSSSFEKGIRLYLCNWQSRLWTLQEGVLASNLFFGFKGGPQTIQEIYTQEKIETESAVVMPAFFCSSVDRPLTLVPMSVNGLRMLKDEGVLAHVAFIPLVRAVMTRTTTHKEDETICMASMMRGMDVKALQHIHRDEKGAEIKRGADELMQRFLGQVGRIESRFIFNDLPRLQNEGYGWAPISFLGQVGSLGVSEGGCKEYGIVNRDGTIGFHVTFSGIKLEPGKLLHFKENEETAINIIRSDDYTVGYNVTLQPPVKDLNPKRCNSDSAKQYAIIISGHQSVSQSLLDPWLVSKTETKSRVDMRKGSDMSTNPMDVREKGKKCFRMGRSQVILGLLDNKGENGPLRIWHVATAKLEPLKGNNNVFVGDWVEDQQWCVL